MDGPNDNENRTLFLGVKKGEVCNRIIIMGSESRALLIAELLDSTPFKQQNEGFLTFTGTFNKIPVSIMCCGIGFPSLDTSVREARSVVDGTLLFVRLGTGGTAHMDVKVGELVVASKGSTFISRNSSAFDINSDGINHYRIYDRVEADPNLSALVVKNLMELENEKVHEGMNATADFFYASQGRFDPNFDDKNQNLLEQVLNKYPDVKSIEMESYHLLDLAQQCKSPIKATAVAIIRSHRITKAVIKKEDQQRLETLGGRAILKAITSFPILETELMSPKGTVWEKM